MKQQQQTRQASMNTPIMHPTENHETMSEDTSGIDKHTGQAPMVATSDEAKTLRYWTCVMHPTVKMSETGELPSL